MLFVGKCGELIVEKDRVAFLPRSVLERQGDQVSKATAWHGVLAWKEPVVRIHTKLVSVGHGLGDEMASHPASCGRRDGGRKEKPDVCSIARA